MRPDKSDSVYESHARKYRSKRQRPCDLCRQRKTQCKIPGSGGACELCQKLARSCTFVSQPSRRQRYRPPDTPSNSAQHRGTQSDFDAYDGASIAVDVGVFENMDLQFDLDVDSQTMPRASDPASFLGQRSDPQPGADDWSYLNFPICKRIDLSSNTR